MPQRNQRKDHANDHDHHRVREQIRIDDQQKADDEIHRAVFLLAVNQIDGTDRAKDQAEEEGQWMCACSGTPLSTCEAICLAMSRNASAAADCGSSTTIGSPLSPPTTTFGSMGTSPRKGTPSISAVRFPPPCPKISSRCPQWRQMK